MADSKHLTPFLKRAEGGFVNDPDDPGGATNKGITFTNFKTLIADDYRRFLKMDDADWLTVFKKTFWDSVRADEIHDQAIADIIVDWVWGSGRHYPSIDIQILLNHLFSTHLAEDGSIGDSTLRVINAHDPVDLYKHIYDRRIEYFKDIVIMHPKEEKFLQGWINRMTNLRTFDNVII